MKNPTGIEATTVSGNKIAINRATREWLLFRKQSSWLRRHYKEKEVMALAKFAFFAGYDRALLNELNLSTKNRKDTEG